MSRNKRKEERLAVINEQFDKLAITRNDIAFSFKYYLCGDNYGESFEEWQTNEYLADLLNKFRDFSNKSKVELLQEGILEQFNSYPLDSGFIQPICFTDMNVIWARLEITGARRLIGVMMPQQESLFGNTIFYVVFLDKDHRFAPSYFKKKRHR